MVPHQRRTVTRVKDEFRWPVVLIVTSFVFAACGAESSTPPQTTGQTTGQTPWTPTSSASQTGSALPRVDLPVAEGETVEGLVDVDGHDIYARCSGKGSPTVVYFIGWGDPSKLATEVIHGIESAGAGRQRICSYERRNTGRSETVAGTQTPEDVGGDVDGVLDAMGEDGCSVHPSAA